MRYNQLTTEQFIERARKAHGNKYDYSKVEYKNYGTKVCIICSEHGEFWQTPNGHLNGSGCPKCGNNEISKKQSLTNEEFILKARQIHGWKYDYSKVRYINNSTKICIICPQHGEFWQTPGSHLSGCGCPKCANNKKSVSQKSNTEQFIEKAKKVHGDKYDYSKVEYSKSSVKVCIICPEHGEFWQTPNNHLKGGGCQKCYDKRRGVSQKSNTEEFIEKARKIHVDKYDYSKVKYINVNTKVCIICPKHGEFWQRPDHHLTSKCGCPLCQEKHLEKEINDMLIKKNISFEREKTFDWLINPITNYNQYLDFYLPEYNVAIECQGEQHFEMRNFFGGDVEFSKTKQRDLNKLKKCEENNITILYFGNEKYKNLSLNDNYFSNKKMLYKKIREYK